MSLHEIIAWVKANELILALAASAFVMTMPALLPKWGQIAQWGWTWLHDALTLFMNMRRGGPAPEPKEPPKEPK